MDSNAVALLVAKETGKTARNSVDFLSFTNLLVKIACLICNQDGEDYNPDPKVCLEKLLQHNILPLLL